LNLISTSFSHPGVFKIYKKTRSFSLTGFPIVNLPEQIIIGDIPAFDTYTPSPQWNKYNSIPAVWTAACYKVVCGWALLPFLLYLFYVYKLFYAYKKAPQFAGPYMLNFFSLDTLQHFMPRTRIVLHGTKSGNRLCM